MVGQLPPTRFPSREGGRQYAGGRAQMPIASLQGRSSRRGRRSWPDVGRRQPSRWARAAGRQPGASRADGISLQGWEGGPVPVAEAVFVEAEDEVVDPPGTGVCRARHPGDIPLDSTVQTLHTQMNATVAVARFVRCGTGSNVQPTASAAARGTDADACRLVIRVGGASSACRRGDRFPIYSVQK